jgi:hypothetical protein
MYYVSAIFSMVVTNLEIFPVCVGCLVHFISLVVIILTLLVIKKNVSALQFYYINLLNYGVFFIIPGLPW